MELPVPHPTTHAFVVRDRLGATDLFEAPIGTSFTLAVADLAEGQLPPWLTLVSVHAIDFAAGTCSDVTAAALHAVAAHVEADERAVPANLVAAFEAYDVPVPVQPPADWADVDAEHRLTSGDYGIGARAA